MNTREAAERLLELYGARDDAALEETTSNALTARVARDELVDRVARHIEGQRRAGVFILQGGTVRLAALDLDVHGPNAVDDAPGLAERARRLLHDVGLTALIEHTKRAPGRRVVVFVDAPVAATIARRVMRIVARRLGLPDEVEVFPKQNHEGQGVGNGLWLPYFGNDAPHGLTVFALPGGGVLNLVPFIEAVEDAANDGAAFDRALKKLDGQNAHSRAEPTPAGNDGVVARLMHALASSPRARPNERGIELSCPFHGDDHPSAIVFSGSGRMHCSACSHTWSIHEWATSDEGRALIGDELADELMELARRASHGSISRSDWGDQWPEPLGDAAYRGLVGDIVRAIAPNTEADPAALLMQLLVAVGSVVGRNPYYQVEATRHGLNLFCVVVGSSSRSRKGTSYGHVERLVGDADSNWRLKCIMSGLRTGEGLIHHVRDPVYSDDDEGGGPQDAGVQDKRMLVVEEEFATTLRVMEREGNTLSSVLRQAWDSGRLRVMTKTNPMRATDAHISVIGHITKHELSRELRSTEKFNGFANRFLWVLARRSKHLPEGGLFTEAERAPFVERLAAVVDFAAGVAKLARDDAARSLWHEVYGGLVRDREGLFDSVTARAEAQVTRLSCIYAMLDCSDIVGREHLIAALEVWRYAEDSARIIFGGATNDTLTDRVHEVLVQTPAGLTLRELHSRLSGHVRSDRLAQSLETLRSQGRATGTEVATGGRRATRWTAS
jgi:hypothetical protein